jgi:dTDP-D-glucose 4,6-dehydratase
MQVMDLSEGHVSALQYIQNAEPARNTYSVFNLGKGQGYSVLDMVRTMQEASGREIKTEFADRRPGDIAICYADPAKATKELHWTAKRSLEDSCRGTYLRSFKYSTLSSVFTSRHCQPVHRLVELDLPQPGRLQRWGEEVREARAGGARMEARRYRGGTINSR